MPSTITQNGGTLEIQQVTIGGSEQLQYKNATSSIWTEISIFPVTIVNGTPASATKLTVNFTTNISFSSALGGANGYFICGSSYITFNGLSNTVNINGITSYPGLIQNGTDFTLVNGYHTITIKNINTASSGSTLGNNSGYICQTHFGRNIKGIQGFDASTNFILIDNCSNSGVINGVQTGGICGANFGYNAVATTRNCSNSAIVSGDTTGGIFGAFLGSTSGTIDVNNCYNSGNISGNYSAGICARYCCYPNGIVTITNCYNTGNLESFCSGIVGGNIDTNIGSLTVSNCYNTGIIKANAGGIIGPYSRGTIYVNKCYNTGNITGNFAGGITGSNFNADAYSATPCTITNCYSIGDITGVYAGGICGAGICYISDATATNSRVVNISNCYTLGNIAATAGGILGGISPSGSTINPQKTSVTLINCFSNGIVNAIGSGLIANSLDIKLLVTVTRCYIGNNNWSDADAKVALTGTPTDINTNNPGTTWTTVVTGTPYVLSLYNAELYNPKRVSINTTEYVSSEGLFQPGYTYSIVTTDKSVSTGLTINLLTGSLTLTNMTLYEKVTTRVFASKFVGSKPYDYNCNTLRVWYSVCFKEDSEILCLIDNEEKYVKVQEMKPNMLVKTYNEGYVAVHKIGWFNLINEINNERNPNGLYELSKETYPELKENLVLTGRHCILVDHLNDKPLNTYKFARHIKLHNKHKLPCVANEQATPYKKEGMFKIWCFCLESEDKTKNFGIYANGMLVESTNKQTVDDAELDIVE